MKYLLHWKLPLAEFSSSATQFLETGAMPRREGSGLWHLVPYQAFECQDGQVLTGALNKVRRVVAVPSSDFVGTNRIDGRVTASQTAAASLASFLLRLR